MRRVVNFFGGPGCGKSTLSTGLFSHLKFKERNIEYVSEFAKDLTWEQRGPVTFRSQEYIFAQQFFRMERLVGNVDFMVTDSPVLLGLAYVPKDYYLKSLEKIVGEAHDLYESLNYFVDRSKLYIQAGRTQTLEEAIEKDEQIKLILNKFGVEYKVVPFSRYSILEIEDDLTSRGW